MPLEPHEIDQAFQQRCRDFVDQGMPAGQAPDLINFPDRALAMSGWTLGQFPRRDSLTGEILADGQESLIDTQRRIAAEIAAATPTIPVIAACEAVARNPDLGGKSARRQSAAMRRAFVAGAAFIGDALPRCRLCGCTEVTACATPDGPCRWAEPDLCSNPACLEHRAP